MTKLKETYRCRVCGNIVEVLHAGQGELVCCGQPMEFLELKIEDEEYEKHVPVIEETENGYKVKIGSVPHPMEEEHFIQWVELIANGVVYRKHLSPGDDPEAEFCISAGNVYAREYCNVHGHWMSS